MMNRLPFGDLARNAVIDEVYRSFEREQRAPIDLYRVLAHSPEMLRAVDAAGQAIRHAPRTSRRLRELVILRIAHLVGSEYEWRHHVRMALVAGLSEAEIGSIPGWAESGAFGPIESAALALADEVHACDVGDTTFKRLADHFDAEEIIELVVTASQYEAVARILQALAIDVEPEYR